MHSRCNSGIMLLTCSPAAQYTSYLLQNGHAHDLMEVTTMTWPPLLTMCSHRRLALYATTPVWSLLTGWLPRCMECRRGLAMKILSVCPSVRPSLKRLICDKMAERSVHFFISYKRSFSLVFWEEECLVGSDPFYLKFWVICSPLERNGRFWTDIRP